MSKQVELFCGTVRGEVWGDAAVRRGGTPSREPWGWPLLSLHLTISSSLSPLPVPPPPPPQESRTKQRGSSLTAGLCVALGEGLRRWREDLTVFPQQIGTRARQPIRAPLGRTLPASEVPASRPPQESLSFLRPQPRGGRESAPTKLY